MRFEDLGLEPKLLKAVTEAGYETPTPIQAEAIPEALKGKDILGIAQTGTGKTASFVLPMIDRLAKGRAKARMPRSLIITPTRELAAQIAESFEKYGKYHKLSMALLIGGVSFGDQDAKLTRGVDVLVATPGRLLDHFERGKLLLTNVQVMVVDEADRMLDMGFIPDIERIFKLTPFTRQTLFFSATMPPEITRLTEKFLSAPTRIEVAKPATAAQTITQKIVRLPNGNDKTKRDVLRKLIDHTKVQNGIIFCNRKKTVDVVAKSLQKHGLNARPIHGDLAQAYRTETLQGFRDGKISLLVASDVAARGLDIPEVSHVFNFDVPIHSDDYVHRIGRTGRAGREGYAVMLVAPSDKKALDAVMRTIGVEDIAEEDLGDYLENLPTMTERSPRSRGQRKERGDRGRKTSDDVKSETKATEEKPKRRNRERPSTDDQPKRAAKSRDTGRENNGARDRPKGRRDDLGENKTVGLGEHMPAFLQVEPK